MFEQQLKTGFRWRHEPARWQVDAATGRLAVEPGGGTDYWSRTAYGFEAANGPALLTGARGNFVLAAKVRLFPAHQYDQAGLLLYCSEACWLKTSVEYEPEGPAQLGVVVTNGGYSDWSMQEFPRGQQEVELRARLLKGDCLVEFRGEDGWWRHLRVAHLDEWAAGEALECGIYACSPKEAGFRAEFDFMRLEPWPAGVGFFDRLADGGE